MRNTRRLYGLLLLICVLGLGTAATTPVFAQKEVPTFTYELRTDAKFKDGTTLTAHDVKWSFERAINMGQDAAFLLADMIHSIEVVDDNHVQFILKDNFPFFEIILTNSIAIVLKKDSVSVVSGEADGVDGAIAWGTGPYRLTSETRDVEVVLERNPNYYNYPNPVKNSKVIITYYASNALLAAALEAGDIDLAHRHLTATKITELMANEADDIDVILPPSSQVRYLVLPNETLYPRINQNIRQAIAYAVDRAAIIEGAWSGMTTPAYTMVAPGMWGHEFTSKFPTRDLAKARELLAAEGYSEANPFEFELWYSPTHYGTEEASVAAIIKAALEETKMMKVTIQFVEWAEYRQKWKATEMEVFLLGWYPDYLDIDTYLYPFYHSSGANWGPKPDPLNPELDSLLYNARLTLDLNIRKALYERAAEIMAEECKVIPLWYGYQNAAFKKDVTGVVLGPDMTIRYENIQKGPNTDGVLRVGTVDKVISLDAADTYDYHSWNLARHCGSTLVDYKEGTTEIDYHLATGPPTIGQTVIGVETVVTTMPITTLVTTTVVSEFASCILVVGGALGISIVLRASRKKRN
ncbi:MAG: ABC transporter substrate-binding protein [Candidatus Heimdallarchaeota archaeon]